MLLQSQYYSLNIKNISLIYANKNSFNSDIPLRFSWVRVVFSFRDSARACAPSEPIWLSEDRNISLIYANKNSFNSNIQKRFSWVTVVFSFRDSARACAPSEPILLSEYKKKLACCMQIKMHSILTFKI